MLLSDPNSIYQIADRKYTKSFIKNFGSSSKTFKTGFARIIHLIVNSKKKFPLFENLYTNSPENKKNYSNDVIRIIIATQIYYVLILKKFIQTIAKNQNENVIDNVFNLFDEVTSLNSIIDTCLEQNEPWIKDTLELINEYVSNKNFLNEIQNLDFFQVFYLELFPRKLRKSLGEVYTPYWLAKHIVNESTWLKQETNSNILDPSCGSGSFIKSFITKILNSQLIENKNKLELIIKNVSGFDINPIAVFTTKINFLLQIINLIPKDQKIAIPIFVKNILMDSNQKNTKYNYIVGNPPWINWENLTEMEKRGLNKISEQWIKYNPPYLNKTLGYVKQDLSGIFFLHVGENYLKNGGKISFLLSKALINGKANSNFRKQLFKEKNQKNSKKNLGIVQIEDLTEIQPFESVKTSTIILHAQKGNLTNLEIPYKIWKAYLKEKTIEYFFQVQEKVVMKNTTAKFIELDSYSNLIIPQSLENLTLRGSITKGKKTYSAKEGANTEGLNSAYWITNIREFKNKLIIFNNYNHRQKNKIVLKNEVPIERDLVFPLVRSGNLKRWTYDINTYIIFTAKYLGNEIRDETQFKKLYPFAHKYFTLIEQELRIRKSYLGKSKNLPFYIMYGHPDMITGYKVCWNRISSSIDAVVLEDYNDPLIGDKKPVPQETVVYINTGDNLQEAHFLCAILNSQLFNESISNIKITGSKSFGTPDILNYVNIPTFDPIDALHKQVVELSMKIHEAVQKDEKINRFEVRINDLVTSIFS
jgi:hypothetical protein